ncbi:retinaldehyde-binding protein 1 [Trichonephila clavata]|uniref:Retinaldehyde-binding protein 1 n=1 Tax=Trichonephila clavata TaxID=2740835 RepID=A0A8X6LES7_TRICU|nr:retinaldehyde-binding protein 1 [Trichonephila clavata]
MMSSTKVIEKLKQGIQSLDKCSEVKPGDSMEEEPLSYFIDYLTPAMIEEARTQLKETDEIRPKALEDLRELIKNERNLVSPTDDTFLLSFLRARKFNVKKAFKLLQNYWAFRKEHRHIYDSSDSASVKRLILKPIMGALTHRDRNGCVVLIFKVGLWDPESDVYEQMFRAVTAVLIHSIQFPATQVCGYRMIFDLRGLSWAQLKLCTPTNMLLMIRSTQYCFPARYKGFHLLSENKLFHFVWAVTHPLLTPKLKKRIMFHSDDLSALKDYINPSILPQEFGGEAETFENTKWSDILEESTDQVMNFLHYGYKD